ncbi:MAG: CpsB/CapC family capsule biosynthesis tyrosine phosphatase [Lachnospiraceae bacterium]
MTTGICDMHCHILPKLDDGSKSVDETIQAIEEGVRQGIRTMIATPHFYPEGTGRCRRFCKRLKIFS